MITKKYAEFKNLDPFFNAFTTGLGSLVKGEHFWDYIGEDITYDFRYRFPGLPEKIVGRDELMKCFAGVCDIEILYSNSNLIVHQTTDPRVIVLECEIQGKSLRSGKPYENRFACILTVENQKIVYWRDYMDSLAAFTTHGENN
ncbi:MAG: nuclear transport factor 2 family protein [Candidatus Obscuribacterales bacterium]|nr:nuclear transport factor 2 family protein [Candidatus Obscuribacterales bacterium]